METSFHQAWITLHQQRDMLYLLVFGLAAIGILWFRFFKLALRWALIAGLVAVAAGLSWGFYHL